MIGKYKEAQGSIKGLQGKVEELEEKTQSGAAEGGEDPAFGATIAALQTQLREVTQAKDEAVQRAEAEASAAAAVAPHQGNGPSPGEEDAGDDPAFGTTIAALQSQLREITQEKDEAVKRAAAAGSVAGGGGEPTGEEAAAAVAAAREQLEAQEKAHQEALAQKQSQNEQLVQKVRQLLTTCRSLKEQVDGASPPGAAAAAAAAGTDDLRAQLDAKQSENDKLLSRLRELAQRYRALQQKEQQATAAGEKEGGAAAAASAPAVVPPDVAERLADAEHRATEADDKAAELTRRCEEAEEGHQRATGSLKEAVERLAALESAADAGAASAASHAEALVLQEEKLRAESAALEERVAGLAQELQASREEKEEASALLEAKTADCDKMVKYSPLYVPVHALNRFS